MKVTVEQLLNSTHATQLDKVEALQAQIKELESFISKNTNTEDTQILLETQVSKNKCNRLNYELEAIQDELTQATKQAEEFWNSANTAQHSAPKLKRLERAFEALTELKSDDVSGLLMFKETLEREFRESQSKLHSFTVEKQKAPKEWLEMVS